MIQTVHGMKCVEFELNSFASSESSRCKLFAKWQRLCDLRSRFGSEVVFTTFLNARREPIARNLTKISDQYYDEMVIQHYRASFLPEVESKTTILTFNFPLLLYGISFWLLCTCFLSSLDILLKKTFCSGVLFGFSDPIADFWRLRYFSSCETLSGLLLRIPQVSCTSLEACCSM